MSRLRFGLLGACLFSACLFSAAAVQAVDRPLRISGPADAGAPAWALSTTVPDGWTADCCRYARAIGVREVLYRGQWSGDPDQVMVLNVWPRKLASLDAEWREDQRSYRQHDPTGVITALDWRDAWMECRGFRYRGSDKVDDLVVFCDPGVASGVRFSWSMALAPGGAGAPHDAVIARFRQVVEATHYSQAASGSGTGPKAAAR